LFIKGVAKGIAEASLLTKHYDVAQMKALLNPPKDHSFGNMWELYNDMALLFVVHLKDKKLLRFLPVLPKTEPGYVELEVVDALGAVFDCCSFGQFLGGLGRAMNALVQVGWVGRHQFQVHKETCNLCVFMFFSSGKSSCGSRVFDGMGEARNAVAASFV
jgi:hypothetical protein